MDVNQGAIDIVKQLVKAGYTAYFAGGWVRDYLMGHPSDDIDIATNAPAEVILDLFPQTILVGLAFGVIIVVHHGHQFEVATFRRDLEYQDGRKPTQIELATPEEDASRRDFTINGMFFDPLEEQVHDFVGGIEDLKHGIIKTIGDPYERFYEDRLRMIRAVRFSARFAFPIEFETQKAIRANANTLFPAVAMERIWQEFCKMAKYPRFDYALIEMHRLELLPTIFPALQGVHLHTIKEQVAGFKEYEKSTAPIIFLMALFPNISKAEANDISKYLRTSAADGALAEYFVSLRNAIREEFATETTDKVLWTYLYAHPAFSACLKAISLTYVSEVGSALLDQHRLRALALKEHIIRVVEKRPLVNATILLSHGIKPGKNMGMILKEAEKVAILSDLNVPDEVLNIVKDLPIWSKQ